METEKKLPRVLIIDDGTLCVSSLTRSFQKLSNALRVEVAARDATTFFQALENEKCLQVHVGNQLEGVALRSPPPTRSYYQALKPGRKGKKRHW